MGKEISPVEKAMRTGFATLAIATPIFLGGCSQEPTPPQVPVGVSGNSAQFPNRNDRPLANQTLIPTPKPTEKPTPVKEQPKETFNEALKYSSELGYSMLALPGEWKKIRLSPNEDTFIRGDGTILKIGGSIPYSSEFDLTKYMTSYADQARSSYNTSLREVAVSGQKALRISAVATTVFATDWDVTSFYDNRGRVWTIDLKEGKDSFQKDLPMLNQILSSFTVR